MAAWEAASTSWKAFFQMSFKNHVCHLCLLNGTRKIEINSKPRYFVNTKLGASYDSSNVYNITTATKNVAFTWIVLFAHTSIYRIAYIQLYNSGRSKEYNSFVCSSTPDKLLPTRSQRPSYLSFKNISWFRIGFEIVRSVYLADKMSNPNRFSLKSETNYLVSFG